MRDMHYPRDPDAVVLIAGAAAALRRLESAGVARVVVTNQSGIAQGKVTVRDYEAVRDRLTALLATEGAHIDASYHCPHHPEAKLEAYRHPDPPLRKPNPGMLLQAIEEDARAISERQRDKAAALIDKHFGGSTGTDLLRTAH